MPSASRPWWQQATALVSLGAGGAITGFSFVPRPAADLTAPSSMPVGLMALEQSAQAPQADNAALRSAIIHVANYYLRMAQSKSPAEMEAIIWQHDSLDGVDHGESCAAFASLTLELGANVVGRQSWVSGGGSYPWPLHKWADARVNSNPGSPGVTSIVQDAQAHQRWQPMGDGYQPQPGDWVVFDGHVEVVTEYAGGVLHTIGGDSVPNFSVNAHEYGDPLSAQGVLGFVDNGDLPATTAATAPAAQAPASDPVPAAGALSAGTSVIPGMEAGAAPAAGQASGGSAAAIPGTPAAPGEVRPKLHHPAAKPGRPAPRRSKPGQGQPSHRGQPTSRTGSPAMAGPGVAGGYPPGAGGWTGSAMADTAAIPGLPIMAHRLSGHTAVRPTNPQYRRHGPAPTAPPAHGTSAQQAFIDAVAPAAVAAQRKYGVPASVTIAQAIDESGWGQSNLAVNQHNLFGIKGTGPAGSHQQQTQEYENGQLVTTTSSFRAYNSAAQSVDDHGRLLATSGYYRQAMAVRGNPNAFAASLTGVYATDPSYGSKIIRLMQQYDLYRYDRVAQASSAANASSQAPPGQATPAPAPTPAGPAPATPGPGTAAAGASIPGVGAPAARAAGAGPPAAPAAPMERPPRAAPQRSGARARPARGPARPQRTAPPSGAAGAASPGGGAPGSAKRRPAPAASASMSAASGKPRTGRPAQRASAPGGAPTGQPATRRTPAGGASTRRAAPVTSPVGGAAPAASPAGSGAPGTASIPGVAPAGTARAAQASPTRGSSAATQAVSARLLAAQVSTRPPRPAPRPARQATGTYRPQIPPAVRQAYVTRAKEPLYQAEPLYRDVAQHSGISWQLLAACDWMQCRAREHRSPVRGEKLGTVNADGTSYRTKSEALEQCADDLATLAWTVYGIDLAARGRLSVRDLANVFAAFRWGGLLLRHRTSALEFPYSVAGLTARYLKMRWPNIDDPRAPDKPGGRFRMPFGAVPVVLFLNYPATV